MRLEIVQIADRGVPNKERLHLRVLADTNLFYYIVFDTSYLTRKAISNTPRRVFWFPPKKVRAEDNVILYTGPGKPNALPNSRGGTDYFFHWGLSKTVWNRTGDCAVLFEVNSWQTTKYE